MRKSTFVWHLTEGTKKMSSDRTIRVQAKAVDTRVDTNEQQMAVQSTIQESTFVLHQIVNVSQNITVGDWCIFKTKKSDVNNICIGLVLAFKFARGRIANEKRYNKDFVDLREYEKQKRSSPSKEMEVLSSWYHINDRRYLIPTKSENHFFIKIENYVATVARPIIDIDTKTLFFPENEFKKMEADILKILNEATNEQ